MKTAAGRGTANQEKRCEYRGIGGRTYNATTKETVHA